jgi:hypothetical protein
MSAAEKEKVLKECQKFIKSDFSKAKFTKPLHEHLTLHCSFIAHFNQQGFYSSYFDDPEDTLKFLRQFDRDYNCTGVEYGSTHWLDSVDYTDINTAMVGASEPYKSHIYKRLIEKAINKKRPQIERLSQELTELENRKNKNRRLTIF